MRVLYLGKFDYPHSTENYVTWALESLGNRVQKLPTRKCYDISLVRKKIDKFQPDFLLFSKPEGKCFPELIEWAKGEGLLTVCWLWDLYWGFRSNRPVQFRSDMVFTTDGGHESHWREAGINHRVLRQGIHAPDWRMYDPDYQYDVAFVGSTMYHPERWKFVRWLRDTYGHRLIVHERTRGDALNRALSQAKVVVGDSWPSRNYWSNRIYEITGRGGFLLFPRTEGLDAEFQDGTHYVAFDRPRGSNRAGYRRLKNLIDYWVDADQEREEIRRAGFIRCGENYTYTHRVESLLSAVRERIEE